jgi:hypothetical protein
MSLVSARPKSCGAQAVGMRAILVRERHPEAPVQCDTLHDVVPIVEGDPS